MATCDSGSSPQDAYDGLLSDNSCPEGIIDPFGAWAIPDIFSVQIGEMPNQLLHSPSELLHDSYAIGPGHQSSPSHPSQSQPIQSLGHEKHGFDNGSNIYSLKVSTSVAEQL